MPIYTYRAASEGCDACRDNFEVEHGMKDPRLTACPTCGAAVMRIIGAANVVSGHHFGETMTREKLKRGGLRKLVRDDSGNYVDDTPS